jgi:hypothetical protein
MNRELERILFTPYFSFNDYNKETINTSKGKSFYNDEDFKKYDPHRIFTYKQKEECWNSVTNIFIIIL